MFELAKIINGKNNTPEPEYQTVTASEAYSEGEALVISGGKLTKCGATVKPTHIALKSYSAGSADTSDIPAYRITPDMQFDVPVSAAPTTLKVGEKVTLDADALRITATTDSGVATIVDLLGATAIGDKIRVIIE